LNDGIDLSADLVRVTLAQKGAYAATRQMRLFATDKREDYASDEMFANFRVVRGGKLGANALYRSSIPSSIARPRAPYADRLAEKAGVKTFLNLANPPATLKENMQSAKCVSPYYRSVWKAGGVITQALPAVFDRPSFKAGLAKQLKFAAGRPGPYLVHCAEGKDRAGFVAFLLAALMDASRAELERDYGESYVNYYHLKVGEKRYAHNVTAGIRYFCRCLGAAEDEAHLQPYAEKYVLGIGLSADEVKRLKEHLGAEWETNAPEMPVKR
ncbi:MAG: tyrosine-protein phosphatase, partial [Pyramidobacter sp.]|nr:tyrosine-protein phosphatase [Pyramidobacter sp.]